MINDNRNQVAIGAENEIGSRKREKLSKKGTELKSVSFTLYSMLVSYLTENVIA